MREQFTVRVYDSTLLKRIKALQEKLSDNYTTTSSFLVYCIERGLDVVERDVGGIKSIQSLDELYDEIRKTFEKLNNLIKFSEKNARELMAHTVINEKLLSCNYNMLLGLSDKIPKKREYVESGLYDDIPERLESLLEDVLKVYLKQNG